MNLFEEFDKLKNLNEETFEVNREGIEKLRDFQDEDPVDDLVDIYDLDIEDEDEDEKCCKCEDHKGNVVLDCSVCHSKLFKDKKDVKLDEDADLANVGDECPYCHSTDGYKVVGEIVDGSLKDKNVEESFNLREAKDNTEKTINKALKMTFNMIDTDLRGKDKLTKDWFDKNIEGKLEGAFGYLAGILHRSGLTLRDAKKTVDIEKAVENYFKKKGWQGSISEIGYTLPEDSLDEGCCKKYRSHRNNESLNTSDSKIRQAVREYQKLNSDPYSKQYSYLMYNKRTGEIWNDEFYSVGHNQWKDYKDSDIVNISRILDDRNLDVTFENVKKLIDREFSDSISESKYRSHRNNESLNTSDSKIRQAVREYQKLNSDPYSKQYSYLMYNKRTGEIWNDEFYSVGHNQWKDYKDSDIVNISRILDDRNLDVTFENVKKLIDREFSDSISESKYRCRKNRVNEMLVTSDISLKDFTFWSGAKDIVDELTDDDMDVIETDLEEIYPDGIDETELNDFFWFERDTIAEWLGYEDFDELMRRRQGEDVDGDDDDFDESCKKNRIGKRVSNSRRTESAKNRRNIIKEERKRKILRKISEALDEIEVKTGEMKLEVTSDENGKVTVSAEPSGNMDSDYDEVVEPTPPETEMEIEGEFDEPVDTDESEEEFDEESFDEVAESYLRKIDESINSYKTNRVFMNKRGTKLCVEGIISRRNKGGSKTSFVFESKIPIKSGANILRGLNESLVKNSDKNSYKIYLVNKNGKLVTEGLKYKHPYKSNIGKTSIVEGFIRGKKNR